MTDNTATVVAMGVAASTVVAIGPAIAWILWRIKYRNAARLAAKRMDLVTGVVAELVKNHGIPELPAVSLWFDCPLTHVGGYRDAPLASVATSPRRGFRAIAYQGNDLALRARPTSTWRLLGAWLRGAVARLWWRNRTEWGLGFVDKSECVTRPLRAMTPLRWRRSVTSTPQSDAVVRDAMAKDCYELPRRRGGLIS